MKKMTACLLLVFSGFFVSPIIENAFASDDIVVNEGWYQAVPSGGGLGPTFWFYVTLQDRVLADGVVYVMESDGDGGYRYRHGSDYYTFDETNHTWTFYDDGFAVFGGTYSGPF